MGRTPAALVLAAAVATGVSAAFGQTAPPPAVCLGGTVAQAAECATKLERYEQLMDGMAQGVSLKALDPLYREVLAPHFAPADLARFRFGYSPAQAPGRPTTDCDQAYFESATLASLAANRQLAGRGQLGALLHALAHASQCATLGSRERYARAWFDHLDWATMRSMDLAQLHAATPLEPKAVLREEQVWQLLDGCCIDQNGLLIRPLAIIGLTETAIAATGAAPAQRIFTVKTAGGAHPLSYQGQIERNGVFQDVTTADGQATGASFAWSVPPPAYASAIPSVRVAFRVSVRQARTSLPSASRDIQTMIAPPAVPGVLSPPA
ncbi:MAG: hypothetical protein ACKVZ0_13980 [Gemmatimonadales bacterium]